MTGGNYIELWQAPVPLPSVPVKESVEFFIDEGKTGQGTDASEDNCLLGWKCVWQCRPATPIQLLQFSHDGLLFASVGKVQIILLEK